MGSESFSNNLPAMFRTLKRVIQTEPNKPSLHAHHYMRHPSDYLPSAFASRLQSTLGLIVLGLLTWVLGDPMRAHSDALVNPSAPFGILSLQFACNADAAKAILNTWDSAALLHARLSLYWDMGFAPAYGIALAALTERFFAYRTKRGFQPSPAIAWLPIWAALADWLENLLHLCLISASGCGTHAILPALACSAALLKWGLLSVWLLAICWHALRNKST
jgi:hypothetical protein